MSIPNAAPAAPAAPQQVQIQQPQTNDEKIGSFARDFLADIEKNDDPDNPDLHREAPQQAEAESDTSQEVGEEAETPDLPEIPMVEIDVDGEKYNVPEKVKHRVMADKDYRQKTMELSAQRKQVDQNLATAAQLAQQAQQMAPYHAQLFAMDNHAKQLEHALQHDAELANDPLRYNRVQGELALLLRNRDAYAQGLHQQVNYFQEQQQQLRMRQLQAEAPKLFEEFPDLQKPETRDAVIKYVQEQNLPPEAIDFLNYSAVGMRLVQKARLYDQMVKDQAANRQKLQERTKTLPGATQSSRAADSSANTKQLMEKWQKGGGKINDPAFDALLGSKLRGK